MSTLLDDKLKAAQAVIDAAHEVSLYASLSSETGYYEVTALNIQALKDALDDWRKAKDKLNERNAKDRKRGLT